MKKLIALAATVACGAALAVESANIVGYTTQDVSGEGSVYNVAGFCFANVGLTGQAKFSDLSATGWDWESDELRIINPANCANSKVLMWLTKAEAQEFEVGDKAGWYDSTSVEYAGDMTFDLGSGFMTRFSSTGIKFQYAGQVFDQAFTIPCANKVYAMIPNALPRPILASEISATGWDWESDELRILNPANCANSKVLMWLTKAEAQEFEVGDKAGWYDSTYVEYAGNLSIQPGDGFMTRLSSTNVSINMPAVTPAE